MECCDIIVKEAATSLFRLRDYENLRNFTYSKNKKYIFLKTRDIARILQFQHITERSMSVQIF